jgi:hypothetical protein
MEYASRADDSELANRRSDQEASVTPEEKTEFVRLFSGPRRLGRDRFGGRLYDLVKHNDGTIAFVQNALDAEIKRALAKAIEELFGPEPAEDSTSS